MIVRLNTFLLALTEQRNVAVGDIFSFLLAVLSGFPTFAGAWSNMDVLLIIDIIGTFVFAISGALTARDKELDIFGAGVVAFVTALGGGTLRDLLLGQHPVGWMHRPEYLALVLGGLLFAIFFKKLIAHLRRTLFLFDTIGIAVFTIFGLEKALAMGLHPVIAVMMGMVSAVFGGVVRDIICNEIPLIFRREIYALACLAGGMLYLALGWINVPENYAILSTVILVIALRIIAVRYKLQMPKL